MGIMCNLAMTAAEILPFTTFSHPIAWMSCHFSAYGSGLSNLPRSLPEGSLLILDDSTPLNGHDHARIIEQLIERIGALSCDALLLDFERSPTAESTALVDALVCALPCPVAVSASHAPKSGCAVFLPPLPPDITPAVYLERWHGREIWLEASLDAYTIELTTSGATVSCASVTNPLPHRDSSLYCHYGVELSENAARFTLSRTAEDLLALCDHAQTLGVCRMIGFYRELSDIFPVK